ncbi:MAG: hypothetical protein Ct9H300mP28_22280 [Pseudomonadota bacterium]|nr:MAG: hypothetical protein Ct9H300mP28_22280 [Pseudomonadota bacterium]
MDSINLLDPLVLTGFFVGAMLPFLFSAMTMKSVGKAAFDMIEEVRRQFRTIPGIMDGKAEPDYEKCVEISTTAALREMIPPGILIMGTPLLVGFLFGVPAVAGILAGSLVSGVCLLFLPQTLEVHGITQKSILKKVISEVKDRDS